MKNSYYILWYIVRVLMVILVAFALASCTRTVYVPKETVKTEYRDRVKYDSIYERDSIFVKLAGDTIYITRDRWRDKYHTLRDTIHRIDSVSYPVTVEVMKQVKHIPTIYRWALWIAIAAVGYVGWRVKKKFW